MRSRAVSKVQIDQALVRNAYVFGDCLEVRDGLLIEPNGNLLLELRRVRIFLRSGEVVFLAHVTPLRVRPGFLGGSLANGNDANDVPFAPTGLKIPLPINHWMELLERRHLAAAEATDRKRQPRS